MRLAWHPARCTECLPPCHATPAAGPITMLPVASSTPAAAAITAVAGHRITAALRHASAPPSLAHHIARGHAPAPSLQVRSTSITLKPGSPRCGSYTADTMTAGSCALLAQSSLPCALFAKPQPTPASTPAPVSQQQQAVQAAGPAPQSATTSLKLLGGTDAELAPPASYLREVLAPLLRSKLGLQLQVEVARRGFYPRGGGILSLEVGGPAEPAGPAMQRCFGSVIQCRQVRTC